MLSTRAGENAKRAMLEWIDSNADHVMQALRAMGARQDAHALEFASDTYMAGVARESADSWRKLATELSGLYEALPARDEF